MKILVIGSGGREHALVWSIARSNRVKKIYCAPGNAGIASLAERVSIKADDIIGLLSFAKKEKIGLTVVGPEAPLAAGIVDEFQKAGLKAFGPSKKAAQLEASKAFAKRLMLEHGVPTAASAVCLSIDEANEAIANCESFPIVIKADGLAAGKGVVICKDEQEALSTVVDMQDKKIFGRAGETIIIEEFLEGEEASILVLTDGKEAVSLASSQDHKRIFDEDRGPNTGGMGAYSPAPVVTEELLNIVMEDVVGPVLKGMSDDGAVYRGVLYAGIMITKSGPKVLEFNVRFGDPETQSVLARLESDIIGAMLWTIGEAKKPGLKWSDKVSVCVVVASGGYPGEYEKGKVITGLEKAAKLKDVVVFHAGTIKTEDRGQTADGRYYTDGGRVLGVTALGKDIKAAASKAYEAVKLIHFDKMHYRKDIGWRALKK
ncbi:MAG: phosphoribosylamine--glycine ligase [Candidatus Omnitrophica bacterium CG_4_10_14_0_2_um_filter_44_9]|nr:MAG: phosphoribosylamine--glycine ligase [Candidatus Omnitrophica bacterium CG_4_10_14_0_8_um_filter_44_12]PIZ84341.1 MAG: phosphoribosylamine--glycine ligase [Candidatus Omnitrophica bacterium CG_4_10_14_0_2_um_filter_44_9]